MTNRHQRRAVGKQQPQEFAPLPPLPNWSGTKERCDNCRFSVARKLDDQINHLCRKPKREENLILCLRFPGGGVNMADNGWCGYYEKREEKNDKAD